MQVREVILMAAMVLYSAAPGAAGPVGQPSMGDERLMREALTSQLLDPESAIIEDVVAIDDPQDEGAVTICGQIRGKNSFGGYAQPQPFLVMVNPMSELLGGRQVIAAKIADTDDRAQLLRSMCDDQRAAATAAAAAPTAVQEDLRAYSDAQIGCEIMGEGCADRDAIAARLQSAGWCERDRRWLPCEGE